MIDFCRWCDAELSITIRVAGLYVTCPRCGRVSRLQAVPDAGLQLRHAWPDEIRRELQENPSASEVTPSLEAIRTQNPYSIELQGHELPIVEPPREKQPKRLKKPKKPRRRI